MDSTGTAASRLRDALREYAAAGAAGVLRVTGRPGGTIYFADDGISGCETSAAPGLEVILLRSGRVKEADWEAAFSAAAIARRPLTDELVQRGLLGAGEAEALLRTALADAVFAVLSGTVDSWTTGPAAICPLPLIPAARPGLLLGEAARRTQVLASFTGPPVGPFDRIATTQPGSSSPRHRTAWDALLTLSDGRRTTRDLAFALGRGVYATMLEVARMRAAGLVVVVGNGQPGPSPSRATGPAASDEEPEQTDNGLPRRRKDRSGSHRAADQGRRIFTPGIRLLRPRSDGGTG